MNNPTDLKLTLVGSNHKHAPISIREKLWCPRDSLKERLKATIEAEGSVREAVILSTCNRTEVYATSNGSQVSGALTHLLSSWSGVPIQTLQHHLYVLRGEDAVHHLLMVSAGLDSLILGEEQIQTQVNDAYKIALEAGTIDQTLAALFRVARRVGSSARKLHDLSQDKASVASAAASLVLKTLKNDSPHILLIGAGNMVSLAADQLLQGSEKCRFLVASRTKEHAEKVAERLHGDVLAINGIREGLLDVDGVLSSTSSTQHIILKSDVEWAMERRNGNPLILFDMGLPRNIDPEVGEIHRVRLYNIDDLAPLVVSQHNDPRVSSAEAYVRREVERFTNALKARRVAGTVRELRSLAEEIRGTELSRALRRLQTLNVHDRKIVDLLTHRIVNKLLHSPTVRIRQRAVNGKGSEYETVLKDLFELEEES